VLAKVDKVWASHRAGLRSPMHTFVWARRARGKPLARDCPTCNKALSSASLYAMFKLPAVGTGETRKVLPGDHKDHLTMIAIALKLGYVL
jgi:hypothetical protein